MFRETQGCLCKSWSFRTISCICQWIRNSPPLMTMSSAAGLRAQINCTHVIPGVLVVQCSSCWLLLLAFSVQILISLLKPMLLWWQEGNTSAVCLPKCLPAKRRQVLEHWCVTTLSGIGLSNYIHSYHSSGNIYAASVSGTEVFFSMCTLLNAKPILLWSFCLLLTSCSLFPLPRLPCALFHLPFVLFQGCPRTSVICEYPWNSMVVGTAQRWFRLSEFNLFFLTRCFSSKQMLMQVSLCGENLLLILLARNKALFKLCFPTLS